MDKAKEQTRAGFLRSMWNDPRSPSLFLKRTPLFRNRSASKFAHQELNETSQSIESHVDLDILTTEEQDSLDLNKDLTTNAADEIGNVFDPRSPTNEITRTPIVFEAPLESALKNMNKKEDKLMKKLADKLVATSLANEIAKNSDSNSDDKPAAKKTQNNKNLIFEDDENMAGYSTPPKMPQLRLKNSSVRTPLSCVANTQTPTSTNFFIPSSTPKSKFLNDENKSRIPVSARRLH